MQVNQSLFLLEQDLCPAFLFYTFESACAVTLSEVEGLPKCP